MQWKIVLLPAAFVDNSYAGISPWHLSPSCYFIQSGPKLFIPTEKRRIFTTFFHLIPEIPEFGVDNFHSLKKLGICFTRTIDQYQTPNDKIKFFDQSIIIHTPVIFKDCCQLLTFCLRSSKFTFCYAVLGMLSIRCVVNNPLYYGHRSLCSAFSGCLPGVYPTSSGQK